MNGNDVLFVRSSKREENLNSDEASSNEDDVWDDSLLIDAYNKAVDIAQTQVLKTMQNHSDKGKGKNKKKSQWKVGDHCRCLYTEDNIYYEADIIDIIDDMQMCMIKYVGYENEEKVPLSKLRPSKGEVARSIQMKQALQYNCPKDGPSVERPPESESQPQSGKKKNSAKKSEKARGCKETAAMPGSTFLGSPNLLKPPLLGAIPPPPPPHMFHKLDESIRETDAMSAMLMSWYMSGYHTGYYQGLKAANKK